MKIMSQDLNSHVKNYLQIYISCGHLIETLNQYFKVSLVKISVLFPPVIDEAIC